MYRLGQKIGDIDAFMADPTLSSEEKVGELLLEKARLQRIARDEDETLQSQDGARLSEVCEALHQLRAETAD